MSACEANPSIHSPIWGGVGISLDPEQVCVCRNGFAVAGEGTTVSGIKAGGI